MITLDGLPKNKDKFIRLNAFFKIVLDICTDLEIVPILDGSLAVFAYTGAQEMNVNDIDLSCSEADFPRIMQALTEQGIAYRLREWHVLQVLKDDLKVEFSSTEHWLNNLPLTYETLQLDGYRISMLSLQSLHASYRQGMADRAGKPDRNEQIKYADLRSKYALLSSVIERS